MSQTGQGLSRAVFASKIDLIYAVYPSFCHFRRLHEHRAARISAAETAARPYAVCRDLAFLGFHRFLPETSQGGINMPNDRNPLTETTETGRQIKGALFAAVSRWSPSWFSWPS